MKKDNLVYIEDMLNSCNQILSYVFDVTYEDLAENQMLLDAVIRNVEVIGEAANKLDEEFRSLHPNLDGILLKMTFRSLKACADSY